MIKNRYVAFVLFLVFFVVFWNLSSLLFHRGNFQFNTVNDLLVPFVTAVVVGYLSFLRERK